MASGASSLESNGSNESISHDYVTNERHNPPQLPTIPIPIEYDSLSPGQCYEGQNYTVKGHGMSAPYDSLPYDLLKQQTNESLKQQCDKAYQELNQLRRQNSETSRRCDHVMKELEYFRGQHRAAMSQLEASAQEANSLRGKYGDLLNDNQRLEREVAALAGGPGGAGGADAFAHSLRNYDALKEDCAVFQKRYDELIENHEATQEQLRIVQEENSRLTTQCHELTQERNAVIRERNALKAQAAALSRGAGAAAWDASRLPHPHPAADVKRLTDERNAALAEYTLIMSERDTVHKEMEKLADDLQAALKRVAALEAALQAARDQNRAEALQAESLRLEIESALAERDRAVKECCDLKAPAANANRTDNAGYHLSSGGNDGFINGQSNDPELDKMQGLPGGGSGSGEAGGAEPDAAEAARLRALTERLRADLARTTREAEVSKRRRDWAFSERDKLLQERESVKALCNRLRKERDQMVSELAEARRQPGRRDRDRDRDRRSPRPPQVLPHEFHACDLLVDEEDYEWDTIEVELNGLGKDGDLGFELSGGLDEPYYHGDTALYVTSVKKGSVLEGKINILDRVTEAVGVSSWQSGGAAAAAVRAALARGPAALRLQRARYRRRRIAVGDTRGLALAHGIFVSKIACGSAAAKDGNLCVGDRIASINNRSLEGVKSVSEAMACLNDCQYDAATLTVLRPLFPCCDHRDSTRCADCESRSRRGHGGPGSGSGSGAGSRSRDSAEGPDRDDDPTPQFDRECFQVPFNRKVLPRGQYYSPAPPPVEKSTHPANMHPGYKVQKHEYIDFLTNTGGKLPSEPPLMSPFDNRYVYHLAASSQGKIHQERGTWDMIRGKIEAVTGRSKSKDKQNKVPESDAIAELDSVIDSYHGKTIKETSSVLKRSRRKNKESQNDSKNGGTWPKARANFILEENSTGTIVQPRARKERPPLSILLSPPTKLPPEPQRSNTNRNSNPIPLGHAPLTQVTAPARHSVYKSIETPAIEHFPKPAPLAIHNPFASPSNFDKIRTLEKDKMSISDYSDHDITPNRLSLVLNPSDDSLDYQPVTRNRNKSPHSLDFIVNKGPSSLDFVTRKSPSSLDHSIKNHPGKDILEQYYSKKSTSPKTVNKYPSDSDSFGPDSLTGNFPMAGTLPTAARLQYYRGPFANANPHPRYPAPAADTPQSRSGESLGGPYDMHFPTHAHNMSDLQPDRAPHHSYEGGTFPRKKENQRFRVPSNPSVTSKNSAGKLSTGSIERADRGSPTPIFHVEVLSPGRAAKAIKPRPSAPPTAPAAAPLGRPLPGELRRIHIDKSQQPLGIQINCPGSSGGVFVSTVYDNSLASKVGLQVGDQLLDVCGINMRTATYTLAASVLRQIGNSISMLVQYSPEKYRDELARGGTSSSSSDEDGDDADADADAASLSGSATPRNSPGPQQGRLGPPGAPMPGAPPAAGPRYLLIEVRNCADLGISLVGGNAVGIFVHSVGKDSPAHKAGLRTGDQILEFNNADLRRATAEQAALELAKPSEAKISVLVRHDLQQYHDIKDKPGDAFYIRAGFDRSAKITSIGLDVIDGLSLWFRKDDVLYVDNTLVNGAPGLWGAWTLDEKGSRAVYGTIPSKFKVEEILRRSMGSLDSEAQRRAVTTARRSFFRRKKHRDSKELASFSNTELGCWSDSGTLSDDAPILSYERVERLHYGTHRPVVIIGPLWECVVARLTAESPHVFGRVRAEPVAVAGAARALQRGTHLEPRPRRDSTHLDWIPLQAIRDMADKGIHCILDISVTSIEKLHKQLIYPIVLFIKFKSFKQIKEVKDTRYPADKVSAKAAKEMYEYGLKIENEYRSHISAEIPAGVNIAYMCTQVKEAVEDEQNKTLWVPAVQA